MRYTRRLNFSQHHEWGVNNGAIGIHLAPFNLHCGLTEEEPKLEHNGSLYRQVIVHGVQLQLVQGQAIFILHKFNNQKKKELFFTLAPTVAIYFSFQVLIFTYRFVQQSKNRNIKHMLLGQARWRQCQGSGMRGCFINLDDRHHDGSSKMKKSTKTFCMVMYKEMHPI